MNKKEQYLYGMKAGLPVVLGFIPVGIAFAIMARQSGFSFGMTGLLSLAVFAGASQMMAVGMYAQGASVIAILLATFILNLRHLIMSTCVMNKCKEGSIGIKLLMAFGVTDESFAIFTTTEEKKSNPWFFLGLITVTYASWNAGTIIGCFAETLLPQIVSDSLGIALYAMFIGLLIPNIKHSMKLGIVVLLTAVISYIANLVITPSWSIIIATLIGAGLGVFLMEDEQ